MKLYFKKINELNEELDFWMILPEYAIVTFVDNQLAKRFDKYIFKIDDATYTEWSIEFEDRIKELRILAALKSR